ncbi:MAG TPA: PKD domain-containing protein [Candidatus Thermoplasmatota archaeon]|nr:PKD domain-containing protein [Candidatus Thermoplasmatota archaeon]
MKRTLIALMSLGLLMGALPLAGSAAATTEPMGFGMEASSVAAQTAAGVKPDYGSFWIGPWTLSSGWGSADTQLTNMKNAGVTPAVHFYYWGDDISPDCVENGCWSSLHNAQKDRAHWQTLAQQMTDHFNSKMGGKPVLVFLESEFNKGGISSYEPFDGYMADKAAFIHAQYPAAKVVLAFGNWGSDKWQNFDRAAAQSDYTGIQGLRGSTHQDLRGYGTLYEGIQTGVDRLQLLFHKPIVITDVALSSYPEPDWLQPQADTLGELFVHKAELKAAGVQALIYRSWKDSPNMNLANYYGMAERYWGLTNANGMKPAAQVWIDGVKAERAGASVPAPEPTPVPAPVAVAIAGTGGALESEAFATRTAGGLQNDAAASGGKAWNLWSNGQLDQAFDVAPGLYDISVTARGNPANGIAPHMVLSLDGTTAATAAPATSYGQTTVQRQLSGLVTVRIAFTNDAKTATEDRNLIVDQVTFTPVVPNAPPVAAFTATADGLTVRLDATTSADPDGDAVSQAWTFGDGTTGTGATATHAYAQAGTYDVVLTVSDGQLTASTTQAVAVVRPNAAPTAAFEATASGLSVAVDASGSVDPDGDALSYAWAFSDGATATGATATHAYAQAGTYDVALTVSDGSLAASVPHPVTVVRPNAAPLAAFAATAADLRVTVDAAASSDPDGDALSYAWAFGDGSTGSGAQATHAYAAAGTYTVQLTVLDGKLSAVAARSVTVTAPPPPQPAFAATFAPSASINAWWVDVKVTANAPIAGVTATVNGGAPHALAKTSWGTYAASFSAPKGSVVVFTAKDLQGHTVSSAPIAWMTTTTATAFTASFSPKAVGNDWWVETGVTANKAVAKVQVRINGGALVDLPKDSWGTYARSLSAPNNSKVVFVATAVGGQTASSPTYTWT